MKFYLEPGSSITLPLLYANSDKDSGLYICLPDGELQQLVDWLNTVAGTEMDALVEACEALNIRLIELDSIAQMLGHTERTEWIAHLDWLDDKLAEEVVGLRAALAKARGEATDA